MVRAILLGLLILLIARAFWRVIDGVIEAAGGRTTPRGQSPARSVKLQRDPVCGTFVSPATALAHSAGSATLYFCSDRCRDEYIARTRASSASARRS
jgi:YHS domain-containing protein